MTRVATRRTSFSSSTTSTRGRVASSGSGFGGGVKSPLCSLNFRSQTGRGAADQKRPLYEAGALQKQVEQRVHTNVLSVTGHEHQSASMASNVDLQWWHETKYVSQLAIMASLPPPAAPGQARGERERMGGARLALTRAEATGVVR